MATSELTRLASAAERHTAVDGVHDGAVTRLTLFRSSAPSHHDAVVYSPCLCIVVQGTKEVIVGDEAYRYDPARSLLVSVDLPASTRVVKASPKHPCLAIGISLDLAVVGELLADGTAAPPPGPSTRGLALTRVKPPLLDAVGRLVALLDTPGDIAALAPLVHREITYRVLTGPQGARLRQIAAAGAPAHRIARAVGWLKEHFAEPLGVESLARRVGLRPSAFYDHFKGVTGLSPLQYQKRLRLQEARRLFGAPPRQDLTALKVKAQPST